MDAGAACEEIINNLQAGPTPIEAVNLLKELENNLGEVVDGPQGQFNALSARHAEFFADVGRFFPNKTPELQQQLTTFGTFFRGLIDAEDYMPPEPEAPATDESSHHSSELTDTDDGVAHNMDHYHADPHNLVDSDSAGTGSGVSGSGGSAGTGSSGGSAGTGSSGGSDVSET